jgi:hypothetical protein
VGRIIYHPATNMCNAAAGTDSSLPPPPPGSAVKASVHQLVHPVDGDDAGGHVLELSKVYTVTGSAHSPSLLSCREDRHART